MKSLAVAVVSAYLFTGSDPQIMLNTQYKAYSTMQAFNSSGISKYKEKILNESKDMPISARIFLNNNINWELYAASIFRSDWDKLTRSQKKRFKHTLQHDIINRYGHLFSSSTRFAVTFKGDTKYKMLRGKSFAKVGLVISSISSDAEVDIDLIFHKGLVRWALCDVYIDGVSKTKIYRREVRKIYRNKGFDGVIEAFEKRKNS